MVVCNGCTDRTADVAREYGDRVRVIETPESLQDGRPQPRRRSRLGLPAVLCRRGRRAPDRIDSADRRVASSSGDALAASPVMDVDLRGSSLAVRAYYRVWARLPYVREGMIGVGVYALSEEGRRRFGEFPEMIADDGYVRMLFSPSERIRVDDAPVRVYAPERSLRPHAHQDPEPPRPVPTPAALPRARRARADDEVLSQRNVEDRRPTLALAGRGVLRGRPRPDTPSRPQAASCPSTTTSGNAISRHVDPTGAEYTEAEVNRDRPTAALGRAWPRSSGMVEAGPSRDPGRAQRGRDADAKRRDPGSQRRSQMARDTGSRRRGGSR